MTVMTAPPTALATENVSAQAGPSDPVSRAMALLPLIEQAGPEVDRDRRIPEAVLAGLHGAGLYRLLIPRSLGGEEVAPAVFAQVIETVARGDASTAWCLCQASGCSMVSAYLDTVPATEVFGGPRAALSWGPGKARADVVEGGYRVTATCAFASGMRHATWLGAHCAVYEPDGTQRLDPSGAPEIRTMVFPKSSAVLTDIWRVLGLKGTASDQYSVEDLFVPAQQSLIRDVDAERRVQRPLYLFPTISLYASGFAGLSLGVARSTLDHFVELAGHKIPRGARNTLRDNAVIQSQAALCRAKLEAARGYLLSSLTQIWDTVLATGELTVDQRMLIRLAATYAIHQARDVVDTVYNAAGATAIFESNPFERRFRDIHTVCQQVQGRSANFEVVGQYMLGLEPDLTFA